jgi:hypothetical protein
VSTVEFLLAHGCWVEHIHPDTRSRADMSMFRLTTRTNDAAAIRQRATLKVIELIPARTTSEPPTVRTHSYPVSIEIVHTEIVDQAPGAAATTDGGNGGTRNDNESANGDQAAWRGPHRRCRKHRHPDGSTEAPAGRTNGMALDALAWAMDGPRRRTDGVTMNGRWSDTRWPALPPRQRCTSAVGERSMEPWPLPRGPRRQRRPCAPAQSGSHFW